MATLVVQSFSIFDMTEGAYTDTDTSGVIEDAEKTAQVSVFQGYSEGLQLINIKDATAPPAYNAPKPFGKILGKIFTQIFNVQVPDVQYQSYN